MEKQITIPTGNPDAMAWAESFVAHKESNQWELDDIESGLMVGWFANYWAAVNDPLQEEISRAKYEVIGWTYAYACVCMDKGRDIRKIEVPEIKEEYEKDFR